MSIFNLKVWLAKKLFNVYWYCGRCGFIKDYDKGCSCKGPAPWHLCIGPK